MSVEKEQFDKVMGELRRACLPAGGADIVQAYVDSLAGALTRVETERRHDLQIQSAMAADQKAVADALGIPPGEYSGGAGEQLLAIEKLREALARAEADNRQLQLIVNSHANMRDTAQAQLAEAMGFLRFAYDHAEQHRPGSLPNEQKVRAFLAQDEQQEAKPQFPLCNPRSSKFQAALEKTFQKLESMTDIELEEVVAAHMPQHDAQGANAGDERATAEQAYVEDAFDYSAAPMGSRDWTLYWKGWQARAALATQPAGHEPVAYCDDFTLGMLKSGQAYSVGVTPATQRHEGENHSLYVVPAAVRGAEHGQ